jgi:hypothetical protein
MPTTDVGTGSGKDLVITIPRSLGLTEEEAKQYAEDFRSRLVQEKPMSAPSTVILIWL